ncbi:hypothetical protein CDD81_7619 [Ophiocordyceps australis]|uniref:Uncharacterized protein n=1 Tax=Ophiocordyceps australis TaxID=1399860 RepID=A0A2C5Y336_9HYPO|nr:hypothetical protein CDD81_7619 [Ophiocordyceps australis]
MAQPTSIEPHNVATPGSTTNDDHLAPSSKRKREANDGEEATDSQSESQPAARRRWAGAEQQDLVKSYFDVLKSIDVVPSILKRPLADSSSCGEPESKRHKLSDASASQSISDKMSAGRYEHMDEMASDIVAAVQEALNEVNSKPTPGGNEAAANTAALRIRQFKQQAIDILKREKSYSKSAATQAPAGEATDAPTHGGETVVSAAGHAPQERRFFPSISSTNFNSSAIHLPYGSSLSSAISSNYQEKTQTLGEVFAPARPQPALQPPKQPKTQAKGNVLDFYHPQLTDTSKYRTNCYYTTKFLAGHYLNYTNATPTTWQEVERRERPDCPAQKEWDVPDPETAKLEALFRGAFSSFAPCKDDTAAVIPANVAGQMWWQRCGQRKFEKVIEYEYFDKAQPGTDVVHGEAEVIEVDEAEIQKAIDEWDDLAVDPSLEEALGDKRESGEKEVEDILEEVGDLIQTLSSYQRIRNLTLPNSQNRQSSDPVNGDMLASAGPQPSEEELATYQMLKAQLALIIKTLPPFAVAKLNGDQLEELLVSTKVQVRTDEYRGVMDEDEAAVQAQMRAQQQAPQHVQHQVAHARPSSQRTPSMATPYANHFQPNQYGTPSRTPSHAQQQQQQYYRPGLTPNYQQPRGLATPVSAHQSRPSPHQAGQMPRPNGFPNQYATQLAKAQTPYGHQNIPQYATQQRPPFSQMPMQPHQGQVPVQHQQIQHHGQTPRHMHQASQASQQHIHQMHQGSPNMPRYTYPQGMAQQQGQPGMPVQANLGPYTNGSPVPSRTMSPRVQQRPQYSPSPSMQPGQRGLVPTAPSGQTMNRYAAGSSHSIQSQNPGLTGYHTVIPEAQQQRILDQAKARVAAQDRSSVFADKATGSPGLGHGGTADATRFNVSQQKSQTPPVGQRQNSNGTPGSGTIAPHRVTPVPVPVVPGYQQQQPRPET